VIAAVRQVTTMKFTLRALLILVALTALIIVAADYTTRKSRWRMARELTAIGIFEHHFHCSHTNDLFSVNLGRQIQKRGLGRFGRILTINGSSLTNPDQDLSFVDDVAVGMLSLDGTLLTDAGLAHVARMPEVGILSLTDTQITDGALELIASIHGLNCVIVTGTAVTESGIDKLKTKRPNLYIQHDTIGGP
jgi:hypothetical protein